MIDSLITRGVPVEMGTEFTQPIHSAASQGRLFLVQKLVQHGASIYLEDSSDVIAAAGGGPRRTPLLLAIKHGHTHVAAYLRELQERDRAAESRSA